MNFLSKFLYEPNLLVPGRKPVGLVRVKKAHPLAPYLTHAFLECYRNIVTGEATTITAPCVMVPRHGDQWIEIADLGYFTFNTNASRFGGEEGTLLFELENLSTANTQSALHMVGTASSSNHRVFSNTVYEGSFSSTRDLSVATTLTATDPGIHCITSKAGANGMILYEGLPRRVLTAATTATRTAWGMPATATIGYSHPSTSPNWWGWIKHVYIFNKALSPEWLNRLNFDPYQLLEPANDAPFLFSEAAPAGTVAPQHYHHRHHNKAG